MTAFIWLGGKSNEDLGFVVRGTSKRPILPGTVDRTLTIPGRNGQWDFGADMDARVFVLDCTFITRNAFELQQKAVALASLIVDSYGKPKDLEIRFRERPGQFFKARFTGSFDIDRIIGTGMFSLTLTAFDPFANADKEQIFEDIVTSSPYVTTVHPVGEIRTPPTIVLANQGPTTITHFKIANEYQVE